MSHARSWRRCVSAVIPLLILGVGLDARAQDIPSRPSPMDEARRAIRARDYTLALTLYSGLADQGDPDALYQLGALYETGKGVPKDYPTAFSWYKKAAEKGNAKAQFNVASMLESGRGVLQGIPEALSWYKKSAGQNYTPAVDRLADIKINGTTSLRIKETSSSETINALKPSAILSSQQQLHDRAMQAVNNKDFALAVNLYKTLADQGDLESEYRLGQLIETGKGTASSYQDALSWYTRAAGKGFSPAIERLKTIQQQARWGQNDPDLPREELFLSAIRNARKDDFDRIIAAGLNINYKDRNGRTALMETVARGLTAWLPDVIRKGADPDILSNDGDNALLLAVQKKDFTSAEMLLKAGSKIDFPNTKGLTPLMLAAWQDDLPMVKFLINQGADVTRTTSNHENALSIALLKGYKDVSEALLATGKVMLPSTGVDPSLLKTTATRTPLILAVWRGEKDIVDLLILQGADVNATDTEGQTPLSRAAWRGNLDIVARLLKAGARVNDGLNPEKTSPLILAAGNGHEAVVNRLIQEYGSHEKFPRVFDKALAEAIANGHGPVAKLLLNAGASWDMTSGGALGPFLAAVKMGDVDLIDIFLARKMDINTSDASGRTALMIAAENGHQEAVKFLLGRKADTTRRNNEGHTALSFAAHAGSIECALLLVSSGALVNVASNDGNTPLMLAVDADAADVVALLLGHRADVTPMNKAGNSALALAVKRNNSVIVKTLLKQGANPFLPVRIMDAAPSEMKRLLARHMTLLKFLMNIIY